MPQTRRRPAYAGAILVVTLLVLTSDMHTLAVTLRTVSRTGSFSPPRPSRVSDARPVAPVHRPPLPQPARPPTPEAAADRVAHAVQTLAPGTDVSLAVVDRQTQAMDTSHDADRVYRAGQLTKLLIAVDLLTDTEPGGPSADERENCYQMLAASDDAVATNLWDEGDQTEIVTRTAARLGLRATQPPRDPTDWGGTLITARDVVAVYRYITDQLPEPGRALILDALAHTHQRTTGGTDEYFGTLRGPPGLPRSLTQASMATPAEILVHTTGLIGVDSRYVVALLTSAPPTTTQALATRASTMGVTALDRTLRITTP